MTPELLQALETSYDKNPRSPQELAAREEALRAQNAQNASLFAEGLKQPTSFNAMDALKSVGGGIKDFLLPKYGSPEYDMMMLSSGQESPFHQPIQRSRERGEISPEQYRQEMSNVSKAGLAGVGVGGAAALGSGASIPFSLPTALRALGITLPVGYAVDQALLRPGELSQAYDRGLQTALANQQVNTAVKPAAAAESVVDPNVSQQPEIEQALSTQNLNIPSISLQDEALNTPALELVEDQKPATWSQQALESYQKAETPAVEQRVGATYAQNLQNALDTTEGRRILMEKTGMSEAALRKYISRQERYLSYENPKAAKKAGDLYGGIGILPSTRASTMKNFVSSQREAAQTLMALQEALSPGSTQFLRDQGVLGQRQTDTESSNVSDVNRALLFSEGQRGDLLRGMGTAELAANKAAAIETSRYGREEMTRKSIAREQQRKSFWRDEALVRDDADAANYYNQHLSAGANDKITPQEVKRAKEQAMKLDQILAQSFSGANALPGASSSVNLDALKNSGQAGKQ